MRQSLDNQMVFDSNAFVELAISANIGGRNEQQDCFGYEISDRSCLIVICDGMGGMAGGKLASGIAVSVLLDAAAERDFDNEPVSAMIAAAKTADNKICALRDEAGRPINAGSTLTAIMLKDNQLSWCSVGDSRAYILRGNEFVQFTVDQNLETVLREKKNAQIITDEEYYSYGQRREDLISFLGIGDLELIDYNKHPLFVKTNDIVVIMSDGLYKTVSDALTAEILMNSGSLAESLRALEFRAESEAKKECFERDNMTVALIKIK